jgi:hypothetical protein
MAGTSPAMTRDLALKIETGMANDGPIALRECGFFAKIGQLN